MARLTISCPVCVLGSVRCCCCGVLQHPADPAAGPRHEGHGARQAVEPAGGGDPPAPTQDRHPRVSRPLQPAEGARGQRVGESLSGSAPRVPANIDKPDRWSVFLTKLDRCISIHWNESITIARNWLIKRRGKISVKYFQSNAKLEVHPQAAWPCPPLRRFKFFAVCLLYNYLEKYSVKLSHLTVFIFFLYHYLKKYLAKISRLLVFLFFLYNYLKIYWVISKCSYQFATMML